MDATEELIEYAPPKAAEPISDYELERGKPIPSKNHSKLQLRIGRLLLANLEEKFDALSEATLDLPEKTAVPDIVILPKSPDDWQNDEIKAKDVPIITIEILSPTQRLSELEERVARYHDEATGVSLPLQRIFG